MALDRKLSPLEFTVLGVLSKRGPCTAYAVMSEFAGSATSFYRSGAGSIYPLLRRLAKAGIVDVSEAGRGDRHYSLSSRGYEELRNWFIVGVGGEDFSSSLDLLRSRTYFLKVLSPAEREAFFDKAIHGLRLLLESCVAGQEEYERRGDPFSAMAMDGAVIETRARLRWMKRCRKLCEDLP
ncbi:MAG TPA: PadR family transcriptional regulator [Fimbriimonadaceae bacterium]|nr:PadR family transcriptional regulator [Fimbriimonadaceae bacterium]